MSDLIERAAKALWDASDGKGLRVPWEHATIWQQRRRAAQAHALHTLGLLVDPAIGRDLNRLQTSRDEWKGRAQAAERVAALDRQRANEAARSSAEAWAKADELQRKLDVQSDELEAVRDDLDEARTRLDELGPQ